MKNVELKIATAIPDACRRLGQLGLVVSRKKGQIVASSDALAQKLQKALFRYCFQAHSSVKNFGHDFGMQFRKGENAPRQRIWSIRKRAGRFRS
eukprot:2176736-Pyramimonas_sp.AAC.1